ncbi:hypothetical protein ACFQ21_21035 [Ohtaekwangia kribbensis]|uniref:Photosynthesis system II assembly factor Ycf48/Hcf136-like domain-containing protein n=1 Tax=Ohtaekwangia kribbensis TaxID=688913 RepID=A0ABW3K731_9BACT
MKIYHYILMLIAIGIPAIAHEQNDPIYITRDRGQHWEPAGTGLPKGTYVNAWTMHQHKVIVSIASHGVYTSVDKLKSWEPINIGLPKGAKVDALLSKDELLLAGTHQHGIYISYNGGDSWQSASKGLGDMTVRSFYTDQRVILAGTNDGVYFSYDNGQSWQPTIRKLQINAFTYFQGIVFAATNAGIYQSRDGGVHWTVSGMNHGAASSITGDGDKVVFTQYGGKSYVSSDLGATWLDAYPFFDLYTFRITPKSIPILIAPWRNALNIYYYQQLTGSDGLPDAPFTQLLETPYGVLTAVGGGC